MFLPKIRSDNFVVQNLENETLVYDLVTNKALCLNETAAIVFNACDGKTSFDDLKKRSKLTDDLIFLTLDELQNKDLIEKSGAYNSPFTGLTRREVIRRVGLASVVALPLISGLIAPTAVNAGSGATCTAFPGAAPCNIAADCAATDPFCAANPGICVCSSNCCIAI